MADVRQRAAATKRIDFPRREIERLRGYLNRGQICHTHRVSDECGKYRVGDILENAHLGELIVVEARYYERGDESPYWSHLEADERDEISANEDVRGVELLRFASLSAVAPVVPNPAIAVRHDPQMRHYVQLQPKSDSFGSDVLQHFHHCHPDGSTPDDRVHHCGGWHVRSGLVYEVKHCGCGLHSIDRRFATGHDARRGEVIFQFTEQCPDDWDNLCHVESGVAVQVFPADRWPDRLYEVGRDTPGLMVRGNLDLNDRPVYYDAETGEVGTVYSSLYDERSTGYTVLVPRIIAQSGGRVSRLTSERAAIRYSRTGEHLGKFDTIAHAVAYATAIQSQQELMLPRFVTRWPRV
jgi:hypothetical protein